MPNRILKLVIFLVLFVSCSGSNSSDDAGNDVGSVGSDNSGLSTSCGVISDNVLRNPIASSRGKLVTIVSVLDSNAVIVNDNGQEILVKLQGIGNTDGFVNTAVESLYRGLSNERLYLFRAGENCLASVIGNEMAVVGAIVTESGKSFAEQAIARKYAGVIEDIGACGETSLASCFEIIKNTNVHHAFGPVIPCESMPAHVRYRSSDTLCNGNASVTVDNAIFGDVFSIQLRYPDGTDRIIDLCEVASCTPLKVQRYIRRDGLTKGCFGAPGNSVSLSDVNHTSVKRAGNDSFPPRYCIPNVAQNIN